IVDLIEREDFSWSDAFDIARGVVREWADVARRYLVENTNPPLSLLGAGASAPPLLAVFVGMCAVATMPLAQWLEAAGWTRSSLGVWMAVLNAAPVLRGLFVIVLLGKRSVPRSREELAETLAVGRAELVAWILFTCAISLIRNTSRSWFQVFMD